jgi:hypothetical protein
MIYEKAKEKYSCNRVWTNAATSEIAKTDLPVEAELENPRRQTLARLGGQTEIYGTIWVLSGASVLEK